MAWASQNLKQHTTPTSKHNGTPTGSTSPPALIYAWTTAKQPTKAILNLLAEHEQISSELDLLDSLKWDDYIICIVQEPYINFNSNSWANWQWFTIYSNTHQEHPDSTRSIILINTNLSTDIWKQLNLQHLDITAVELCCRPFGTLCLINIYNDCKNNNALTHVSNFTHDHDNQHQEKKVCLERNPSCFKGLWVSLEAIKTAKIQRHLGSFQANVTWELFFQRHTKTLQISIKTLQRPTKPPQRHAKTPQRCAKTLQRHAKTL